MSRLHMAIGVLAGAAAVVVALTPSALATALGAATAAQPAGAVLTVKCVGSDLVATVTPEPGSQDHEGRVRAVCHR